MSAFCFTQLPWRDKTERHCGKGVYATEYGGSLYPQSALLPLIWLAPFKSIYDHGYHYTLGKVPQREILIPLKRLKAMLD